MAFSFVAAQLNEIIAKLSFNFNFNLVESWDSLNFIEHTHPPPTHPPDQKSSEISIETELFISI